MLSALSLLSSTAFACDVEAVGERMGITLTLLLTAVAYKIVLGDGLPKVPYLTQIDIFMFLCVGSLFICSVTALIPNLIGARWGEEIGEVCNFWMLIAFVASLLVPLLAWIRGSYNVFKRGNGGVPMLVHDVKGNFTYFAFEDCPCMANGVM